MLSLLKSILRKLFKKEKNITESLIGIVEQRKRLGIGTGLSLFQKFLIWVFS
jgi:hypothetical protein